MKYFCLICLICLKNTNKNINRTMKNKLIVHTLLIQLKKIKQNKKTKLHQKQNKIVSKHISNYVKKSANHIYNNKFNYSRLKCNRDTTSSIRFVCTLLICFLSYMLVSCLCFIVIWTK